MYIEDLIDRSICGGVYIFEEYLSLDNFDRNILNSLSTQIGKGYSLTEKQRALSIKLLTKYKKQLSVALGINIEPCLITPSFKMSPRSLENKPKTIRINRDENRDFKILVEFPYFSDTINSIKEYRHRNSRLELGLVQWNNDLKLWEFELTEKNIKFLSGLLSLGFSADEEFLEFLKEIQKIEETIEDFVPMVSYENEMLTYKNVSIHLPPPPSQDLFEVLLHARKHGIMCYDNKVSEMFENGNFNNCERAFLSHYENKVLTSEKAGYKLSDLSEIIKKSQNVLFVIPGGGELAHLEFSYNFLKSHNFTNDHCTVLFRLESSFGTLCNDYIKEQGLNNQISDETRFIFISGKVPKPLIESGKEFDLVVYYGSNSAHYTLKNFIRNHHNVVLVDSLGSQRELNFGRM